MCCAQRKNRIQWGYACVCERMNNIYYEKFDKDVGKA